jgi:hypothetical protein
MPGVLGQLTLGTAQLASAQEVEPAELTGTATGSGTTTGFVGNGIGVGYGEATYGEGTYGTSTSGPAELTGTAVGSGTVAATLTAASDLTGAASGAGMVSGSLRATSLLSGTISGTGATAGAVTIRPPPQILVTSADSVDGAWTDSLGGSSLAAAIDELEAANDADFIRSDASPVLSSCRVKLASGQDPVTSDGHLIRWRVGKDSTGAPQIDVRVQLRQGGGNSVGGGTLIAEFTRVDVDALTTYEENLSGGQADAITDYADLYLDIRANQV